MGNPYNYTNDDILYSTSSSPLGPNPVPSGPISRPTGYSTAALELMGFRKGIKREIAAYPTLKDERYFDCSVEAIYSSKIT